MPVDVSRIGDRVSQNRARLEQLLGVGRSVTPCPESRLGCTFLAGDRVIDRVTGEEGVIVGATRENILIPASE